MKPVLAPQQPVFTPRGGVDAGRPRPYFAVDTTNRRARVQLRRGLLSVLAAVRFKHSAGTYPVSLCSDTFVLASAAREAHQASVLLSRESEELPDAYFDALEGVLLAPGWVMATLPVQLQHQVQLCAKQRLVRLLTPVAKLAAHRMKRQALKENLLAGRGTHGLPGPQQLMAASPDLFALWPEASVAELCRTAKVRAYMPHSWVSPPPRSRHQLASSFNDLNGRISPPTGPSAVTLAKLNTTSTWAGVNLPDAFYCDDGRTPQSFGCFYLLEGEVAEYVEGERKKNPLTPGTLRGEDWGLTGNGSPPGLRAVMPSLVMEFDWRDIGRVAQALPEPHFSAVRSRIVNVRIRAMKQAGVPSNVLTQTPFFGHWDRNTIHACITKLVPKVFFKGEVLASDESSDASAPPATFILTRGTIAKMQRLDGLGTLGAAFETRRTELIPVASFGEYASSFDERHDATYVAESPTVDVWVLSRSHLQQLLKSSPPFRKAAMAVGVELRERAMTASVIRDRLRQLMERELIQQYNWAAAAASIVAAVVAPRMHSRVYPAGERITAAGDDATSIILYVSGKVNESTATGFVTHVPPFLFGNPLHMQERWRKSLVAVRNVECWIASKTAVMSALRRLPPEQQVVVMPSLASKLLLTAAGASTIGPSSPQPPSGRRVTITRESATADPAATQPDLTLPGGLFQESVGTEFLLPGHPAMSATNFGATLSMTFGGGNRAPAPPKQRASYAPKLHVSKRIEAARTIRAEREADEQRERLDERRRELLKRQRACEVELDRDKHPSVLALEQADVRLVPPPKDVLLQLRKLAPTPRVRDRPKLETVKAPPPPEVEVKPDGLGLVFNRDIAVELQECKVRVKQMIAAEMRRVAEQARMAAAVNSNPSPVDSSPVTRTPIDRRGSTDSGTTSARNSISRASSGVFPDTKSAVLALTADGVARRRSLVRSFEVSEVSHAGVPRPMTARPPTGPKQYGAAEKRVLQTIIETHHDTASEQRRAANASLSPQRFIDSNPFSALRKRKTPIPRASGVGELFYELPGSPGSHVPFKPSKIDPYVRPSQFSMHSRSGGPDPAVTAALASMADNPVPPPL
jgi:CRP-like cAMP-binding protein